MNEFDEITEKLRQDPKNASFTSRGVGPIYQLSDKAENINHRSGTRSKGGRERGAFRG